jgi:hypothetical protein
MQLTTSNADTTLTNAVNVWQSVQGPPLMGNVTNQFVGFFCGEVNPYNDANLQATVWPDGFVQPQPMVTFCLQYQDSGGNWRPYNYCSRLEAYDTVSSASVSLGPPYVGGAPLTRNYYTRGGPVLNVIQG